MDMQQYNTYMQGAIDQYDSPQNYELVGQTFEFAMDDGIDYRLRFMDRSTLEWNYENEAPRSASNYLCVKGDNTTYLVSFELENVALRTNHTWVIDLENQLVTRILSVIGDHPKYQYVIRPKYEFGAIKQEGVELKIYPRHGYTSDLVGTLVQWFYGSAMTTVHAYYCTNYYRITYPPERAASRVFNEALARIPSSDEPVAYIKIKEGMYLFSLTESTSEKILQGEGFIHRSNTMALLQNYKRVNLVGRSFGTVMREEKPTRLHKTFAAYGRLLDPENVEERIRKLFTDPNPYIV